MFLISIFVFIAIVTYFVVVAVFNRINQDNRSVLIHETSETLAELAAGTTAREIREAYQYALLSTDVYKNNGYDWTECKGGEDIKRKWEPVNIPDLPQKPTDAKSWQSQWDSEIGFKVWKNKVSPDNDQVTIVIAFRGTDGGDDFWSNFRWVTRFNPFAWDQYDMARTLATSIESTVMKKYEGKKIRFVTTGHSLGGGLAQQAAYASSAIKMVYAFDSTSVTGFYSVDSTIREESKNGMRIYRINEAGEILAYLRFIMSLVFSCGYEKPKDRRGAIQLRQRWRGRST